MIGFSSRLRAPDPARMAVVPLLLFGGLWGTVVASDLTVVTRGSVVKLLNTRHNVRLPNTFIVMHSFSFYTPSSFF